MASGEASVEIVDYDPAWPAQFANEQRLLEETLKPWLAGPIEHVGSTAIPGLAAKPVIDIMAAVRTLEASQPAIAAATSLGYCYFPYQADIEHWFCKPSPKMRTHHLHLVPFASDEWKRVIAFRNYLRAHPDTAAEYETLKRTLAEEHQFDREAYTVAKRPFITRITDVAIEQGYGQPRSSTLVLSNPCGSELVAGRRFLDRSGRSILYRYFSQVDDVEAMTRMLHEAYAPLAAAGMKFVASHQDAGTTKQRLSNGEAIVALDGTRIVGTVTLMLPPGYTEAAAFYRRDDVARFGQFAVRVSHQHAGIGSTMLDLVEQRARELGARYLALDTSEHALDLIALYKSRGYQFVEYCSWPDVNYRSVILSRELAG